MQTETLRTSVSISYEYLGHQWRSLDVARARFVPWSQLSGELDLAPTSEASKLHPYKFHPRPPIARIRTLHVQGDGFVRSAGID